MPPLLECVPNFSEGRRADIVAALVDAIAAGPDLAVLDHGADPDHNRCVVTFAGAPDAVIDAAWRGVGVAVERIDLRTHLGVHMRMGAMDVCPFVPLAETPMTAAVDAACRLAARIGDELQVPAFLYGEAAQTPARRLLGRIRNVGFEELSARIADDPSLRPDFGPARLHPSAGAVAVGARRFLIAFNVDLATPDVGIARRIAKRVRESDGGLPCVQARGFTLQSRRLTQVSLNLTNYEVTPVRTAFDAVRALAAAEGVDVVESELIGLAPAAALDEATAAHVRLVGFDRRRHVLEERLRAVGLG